MHARCGEATSIPYLCILHIHASHTEQSCMMRVMMAGCCAEACTVAALIGVMRPPGCPFDSAWCFVCEVCRLTVDWVDCRCFLSFVFLGGARRLELSPCDTVMHPVLHRQQVCCEDARRCTAITSMFIREVQSLAATVFRVHRAKAQGTGRRIVIKKRTSLIVKATSGGESHRDRRQSRMLCTR